MRNQFLVLLLTLAALAFAEPRWEQPIPLEPDTKASLGFSMFMVADGSKSYLLYSRPNQVRQSQELGVKTYTTQTRELSDFMLLSSERMYFGGAIKGSEDGTQLLVAEGASRIKVTQRPPKGVSIYDILLTYSTNSGKTWSEEKSITQPGADKAVGHILPSIIAVEEAGQIYLLYLNVYPSNETAVACMKFTPDSAVSQPTESIIHKSSDPILAFASTYTYANNSLLLHVAWVTNDTKIMYSTSKDCIEWSTPVQIGQVTSKPKGSPIMSLMSDTKIDPSKVFLTYVGTDDKGHLKASNDSGATWAEPVQITTNQTDALTVTLCGDSQKQAIFFLTSTQGRVDFKKYNLVEKKVEDMPNPFGTVQMVAPALQCARDNGKYHIHAMGTVFREMGAYVTSMTLTETMQPAISY
eukprot:TRINITY_DN71350_c2_g1_i1.p1 TRINITY_DN71350_c2_g1~~TRINITY_DN71350_c2_g1_i1.p1  ORF type:complete len:474 (+),score=22.08 TRINITY_DN71350_c2_g1_i1:190-1422(+)